LRQHRLIICSGLYGSGSTWVFNIVAGIERLKAPELKVASVYGDMLDDKLERETAGADVVVLKTHIPDAAMCVAAARTGTPVIVSIRHPHDGVASLMQRFAFSFDDAAGMVERNCAALLRLIPVCRPLILKYEDRFTVGGDGIEKIAAHLGHCLSDDEIYPLAESLSAETVAAFIADLTASGYFDNRRHFGFQCHPPTQWHPNHVGDGLINKYGSVLTAVEIAYVTRRTAEFRVRFGYG
jgi:hypothetical protein